LGADLGGGHCEHWAKPLATCDDEVRRKFGEIRIRGAHRSAEGVLDTVTVDRHERQLKQRRGNVHLVRL
jgi:hypothetical protein